MKIFAHRGDSKEAPENSIEAFRKAIELEADSIEIDCQLTRDKIPVVTHNNNLAKLKLGKGCVHQKTWAELESLGVPSLTEVLELVKPSGTDVILDLKAQPGLMHIGPRIIAGLAQEIISPNRILLSSFYFRHLLTLKKHFNHIPRALIAMQSSFKLVPPEIFDRFFMLRAFHPLLKWTTPSLVNKWHEKGFKVHVWVANSEAQFRRCRELGVDGIFTDDPRRAREFFAQG
ncbi:MAG: glycerophosphodiester phosphodiesterase [Deltaproteobacteria bacterium]|nr:glycerophosphodiester phosphodiesterase [Deltaproteobacteria bacterium]